MAALAHTRDRHEFPFSRKDYEFLARLVYDHSGIVLGDGKMNMVYSRLVRRIRELGLPSFAAYCQLLKTDADGGEMGNFINAVTTNLTRFFREGHHFDHLRDVVLADMAARAAKTGNRRLRIWSAGCSSGEEPYSIAMTVAANLPNRVQWDAKILASDLDTNMVARAAAGRYPAEALAEVPPNLRSTFFSRDGRSVAAEPALRELITFKPLNLLGAWPMKGPFDAIFCRNVMIYFDNPTKNRLISRFCDLLRPGGWLYIGHSETLLERDPGLELAGRTIYRKSAA